MVFNVGLGPFRSSMAYFTTILALYMCDSYFHWYSLLAAYTFDYVISVLTLFVMHVELLTLFVVFVVAGLLPFGVLFFAALELYAAYWPELMNDYVSFL